MSDWFEENTVPFARGFVRDGQLVRICPECAEEFAEKTDRFGEQTTDNYADHYQKEHR